MNHTPDLPAPSGSPFDGIRRVTPEGHIHDLRAVYALVNTSDYPWPRWRALDELLVSGPDGDGGRP